MVHDRGAANEEVHRLAWEAFKVGTEEAKHEGLYGAGQDLLVDAFSGNVRGMGPAVAEIDFEQRTLEPFLMFMADKTEPGAYNLPLDLTFADPMNTAGLILGPEMNTGFRFRIMDVSYTKGDRVIELNAPEDLYDIAALLRDNDRFVVESIFSRHDSDQAASVNTTRLHNIAGKYTGKDDPVMLVRVQKNFPATGEVLAPYGIAHYVGGWMRGSHVGPLTPVKRGTGCSYFHSTPCSRIRQNSGLPMPEFWRIRLQGALWCYFDGPPIVSCLGFCVKDGKLTDPVDAFDHPFWDEVRHRAATKAIEMRRQGFSGAAMLPYSELEYGGIVKILDRLDKRFRVRPASMPTEAVLA